MIDKLAVLSLEPWDDIWRRNQHFASRLIDSGAVRSLRFVTPPAPGLAVRARRTNPRPGISVVVPPLVVPRRFGGHAVIGRWLRHELRSADVLWVNDPVAGASALRAGQRVVYDVTDDWRAVAATERERAWIVAAEDVLAQRAATVVCSEVLAARWRDRYGIDPTVVPNGVDLASLRSASPRSLDGTGPHAVYVGTVHANRVDVDLIAALAEGWAGTVHLVGPVGLDELNRARLAEAGVRLEGPVPSPEVPSWLISADVLISPHLVDDFTMSLDAIKSHEYLATTKPVVATPSSGFQALSVPGLAVVQASGFVAAVNQIAGTGPFERNVATDWDVRAAAFAAALGLARTGRE